MSAQPHPRVSRLLRECGPLAPSELRNRVAAGVSPTSARALIEAEAEEIAFLARANPTDRGAALRAFRWGRDYAA